MSLPVSLSLTADQRAAVMRHVFPDDDCEAVVIALCGRAASSDRHRLVVRRLEPIPYERCSVRKPDQVTWPTEVLVPWLEEAQRRNWAVVKIHGHRGYDCFSDTDDRSDAILFPSIAAWTDSPDPHASVIVMDDGRMFGRVVDADGRFHPLAQVQVVGDDLEFFRPPAQEAMPAFAQRIIQSFGKGTMERLRQLRIAVIGASGTGSLVIEMLARNGVGHLVLVDPDCVEEKNLNRIVNTTMADAHSQTFKVDVAARTIAAMDLGTSVSTHARTLFHPEVVRDVASCDVVFGCVDSIDGRFLLNKLATFYTLPYFDLGVKIEADGKGGVDQVAGSVHYLKPGGSSLVSRHTITMEQVRAAGLRRTDPARYQQELKEGYVRGVAEDRPAVIQLNALIASLAINEFLARLHPYRQDSNADYAILRVSLSHGIWDHYADEERCAVLARHLGRGDCAPLLDAPELSEEAL